MPDLPELPPIATAPLSLVLLAHNASPQLADVVRGWREVLLTRAVSFEIILVDDGSSDDTAARATELTTSLPELKLLRHEKPRGRGAALRTGLAETTHPLIATAPCAPEYRPQDLALFLAEIDRVHFLTGYRAGRPMPLLLRGAGHLWRLLTRVAFNHTSERLPGWLGWRGHSAALLARIFFGVRMRDVGCPFRVFRREILARSPVQSNGEFAWIEQLAKVNFTNGVFGHEVPLLVDSSGAPARSAGVLREAYRVFSHPSFGPAALPGSPKQEPSVPSEPPGPRFPLTGDAV